MNKTYMSSFRLLSNFSQDGFLALCVKCLMLLLLHCYEIFYYCFIDIIKGIIFLF